MQGNQSTTDHDRRRSGGDVSATARHILFLSSCPEMAAVLSVLKLAPGKISAAIASLAKTVISAPVSRGSEASVFICESIPRRLKRCTSNARRKIVAWNKWDSTGQPMMRLTL